MTPSQKFEFTLDISNAVFIAATLLTSWQTTLYHSLTALPSPASIKIYII